MCTIPFENWIRFLDMILTLMIRRAKGLELMKIVFIIHLSTFGSYICDRGHECIIYMI